MSEGYHKFSPGAERAIADWFPITHNKPRLGADFLPAMRQLQRELLRCHLPTMNAENWRRCQRTLTYLDAIDRGEEVYW